MIISRISALLPIATCLAATPRLSISAAPAQQLYDVGISKIDITPAYPIRLCGYAVRKTESQGIVQHLYAKALAIGTDKEKDGPALLLTVDNTGIPASIRNEVLRRLQKSDPSLRSDHFALCSSHSHTAPCIAGNLPTLFGEPIPPAHQAHIDQYTRELVDALEKVSVEALHDRTPAKLFWSQSSADFAANRRTKGGPVDHDLPVLIATDPKENLRGILGSYACHCTTLGGETNALCGDWAGYAQEYLERDHPGIVAMMAIGCGADANPSPRGTLDLAKQHGAKIEQSVNEILAHTLTPITGKLECRAKPIEIPFDTLPTREQWEKTAQSKGYAGYHARVNLAKLDRGESIPAKLPYLVQSWNFGNDLAMIFLPGEVVVDYSKRLKAEFDPARLWVNAYANDVPCYIPSERILKEGGYEGGDAMIYYDKPARLAAGIEDLIVAAVHELVPSEFQTDPRKLEHPPAKSPTESLAAIRTRSNLTVELVAAEPLIVDPVAIDWGPDGKLWVVEMRDYPMGMDGRWKPGSRVKYLESTRHDGKYDKATVFLDNLPFATGVTAWRHGVLVCAAPDIIYAEDSKGTGRADLVKKIFTGFYTENYQARVNSLSLGLDNWIYGANGLLGGVIRGESRSVGESRAKPLEVDIRGRDFRMNPDTGAFEAVSGLTQQGRVRDDWGNWFGCDNSTIAWHYPLPEQYLRRNPNVPAPSPRTPVAIGDDPTLLYPISRTLERFNHPESANRITSGCGMGIYRDNLLGDDLYGNEFTCEPVHNLVHRLVLRQDSIAITGDRAADEQHTEFFASRDSWSRPVQIRTGPDGALYVVDMYRFVIEHPRWIPSGRLEKVDVRAGDDKGRIYRIVAKAKKLRPIRDLTKLSSAKLAAFFDTPNGTERDRIHQELICRADKSAAPELGRLVTKSTLPAVRLQALCVLDGLNLLNPNLVERALSDPHPAVRANAIRVYENFVLHSPNDLGVLKPLLKLENDSSPVVAYQLAFTLGESRRLEAGIALAHVASRSASDSWIRAALLSSATSHSAAILSGVLACDPGTPGRSELIDGLIATAAGAPDDFELIEMVESLALPAADGFQPWQFAALRGLLDAYERKPEEFRHGQVFHDLGPALAAARKVATEPASRDELREPAIALLGHDPDHQQEDLTLLAGLLEQPLSPRCQNALFKSLTRCRSSEIPKLLLQNWDQRSPSQRQACIGVLLTREAWIPALLDAIKDGKISRIEVAPSDQQRLIKHPNNSIQQAALRIWTRDSDRAALVEKFKEATTLPGSAAKGATVFANTCATCHFLHGQGHEVGPDLARLSDKSPTDFLVAILDPNAAIEPRFTAYNIDTTDGRSLSGIVSAETATTLTLVQSAGIQEKILRKDIRQIRPSGVSLMPEGLEQTMSAQDLADLIAYIKTAPRPFGSATSDQAEAAKQEFLKHGMNGFARLISAFDRLPYSSWMGTFTMAYARQTDGNAKVIWQTAPVPSSLSAEQKFRFRLPAAMGYLSNPAGKFTLRLNEKAAVDFDVTLSDRSWESSDQKLSLTYTVMERNEEDSSGVLIIEATGSILEAGKPTTIEVTGSAANSQRWFGIYLLQPQITTGSK